MGHVFPRLVLPRDFRVVVRVDAARDDAGADGRGVRDARWTHSFTISLGDFDAFKVPRNEVENGIPEFKERTLPSSFDTLNILVPNPK